MTDLHYTLSFWYRLQRWAQLSLGTSFILPELTENLSKQQLDAFKERNLIVYSQQCNVSMSSRSRFG
ncbi:rCG22273 [Rattus norvegicus]|uniref:RCG22273 n=1 Tax=Rattus norvegicus TaxID=10116 RepID=A6IP40_RAT|nr:rCG22273 [Rattus norvegicus]